MAHFHMKTDANKYRARVLFCVFLLCVHDDFVRFDLRLQWIVSISSSWDLFVLSFRNPCFSTRLENDNSICDIGRFYQSHGQLCASWYVRGYVSVFFK